MESIVSIKNTYTVEDWKTLCRNPGTFNVILEQASSCRWEEREHIDTTATPGLLLALPSRWGTSVDTSLFLTPRQNIGALLAFPFLGGGFREEDNTRAWPYSCCAKTSSERKSLVAQAPVSSTLGLGKCYPVSCFDCLGSRCPTMSYPSCLLDIFGDIGRNFCFSASLAWGLGMLPAPTPHTYALCKPFGWWGYHRDF